MGCGRRVSTEVQRREARADRDLAAPVASAENAPEQMVRLTPNPYARDNPVCGTEAAIGAGDVRLRCYMRTHRQPNTRRSTPPTADRSLPRQAARVGAGLELYAGGTPEEYGDERKANFRSLGGKRPVAFD